MIPINGLHNYSESVNQDFTEKFQNFLRIFKECQQKVNVRSLQKLKVEKPSKIIFIDPTVKREFEKFKDKEMLVHEIFEVYERWFDVLEKTTLRNEERLHKKTVSKHVKEMMVICSSLQETMKMILKLTPGMSPGPDGPKNSGPQSA